MPQHVISSNVLDRKGHATGILNAIKTLRLSTRRIVDKAVEHEAYEPETSDGYFPLFDAVDVTGQTKKSFNRFRDQWYEFFDNRLPIAGVRRDAIDELFNTVNLAVTGKIPFSAKRAAPDMIETLYLRCFDSLIRVTEEYLYDENPLKDFHEKFSDSVQIFREHYAGTHNVFVSVNYGPKEDQDPDDVTSILSFLKNFEGEFRVRCLTARSVELIHDVADNARLYLTMCDSAVFFFTKSNVETKKTFYNHNLAFELGYTQVLGRPWRVFRHKCCEKEKFAMIGDRFVSPYEQLADLPKEIRKHFSSLHLIPRRGSQ